ncbi:hypothetical protein N0V88_001363 [Collariella sp. IMI 366227]|nr:hypothetical protein N0V88_001363 [Collariella sp. IMI 366227]
MEATSTDSPSDSGFILNSSQEREVQKWVSREHNGGTVVRKELVYWFIQRLGQRDGLKSTLAPSIVDAFLGRHPDLAERLVVPPQPVPESQVPAPPKPPGKRLTAPERMKEMFRQDREKALFGDSPPPRRQPAPYPEGEIIYHRGTDYVVRHGDALTKYTTYTHGFGANPHPNEAMVMRFIKENTTIPVPEVISSDFDRVTMEYVEGQTLRQAWPVLTTEERTNILIELRGYIAQLRALEKRDDVSIGRLDGSGVELPSIIPRAGGPFTTTAEFHHWLVRPPKRLDQQSMYWDQITRQLAGDYPIVFTHGDIAARNILVRDGRIAAIIDWEYAGWFPKYWEYVFTLRGLDNLDWVTLGSEVPSLFDQHYDIEYILIKFILDIS